MIFTFYRTSNKSPDPDKRTFCYSTSLCHSNTKIFLHSDWFDKYLITPQIESINEVNTLYFVLGDRKERIEYMTNPFVMIADRETSSRITKYPMAKAYMNDSIYDIARYYEQYKGILCYWYFEMQVDGHSYKIYDSNHGSKGRYFCIYLDDVLIAIAVFDYDKRYTEATYTVYSEDDIDARILAVLLMYNDTMLIFDDDCGYTLFAAIPKPLKEKYNPDFLSRIAEREEKKDQTKWIDGIDFA